MIRKTYYIALALIMSVSVSCSSVPLTSLPKLAAVKPETMDMSQLELAVRVPAPIGIPDDSAKLDITLKSAVTGETLFQELTLGQPNPELTTYLEKQEKRGYKIYRYKMNAAQVAQAETFRKAVEELRSRSKGAKNQMTLNASTGFCLAGAGELDSIDMTFYEGTRSKVNFTEVSSQTLSLPSCSNRRKASWSF